MKHPARIYEKEDESIADATLSVVSYGVDGSPDGKFDATVSFSWTKKQFRKNHQTSSPHSPDENKHLFFNFMKSNLLINLLQTAYVHGLTLPNCRTLYSDFTVLNIIL